MSLKKGKTQNKWQEYKVNLSVQVHAAQSKVLITENQIIYYKITQVFYTETPPFGNLFLILLALNYLIWKYLQNQRWNDSETATGW